MLQLLEPEIIVHSQMAALINQARQHKGINMGDQKESALILCEALGQYLLQEVLRHTG